MPEKEKKEEKPKVKILDFSMIIMIICLAFIFSLTILNKTNVLSASISVPLMIIFFAIMLIFLIKSIKKNKEVKDNLVKEQSAEH
jgi:L-asparagine transporter-like permease